MAAAAADLSRPTQVPPRSVKGYHYAPRSAREDISRHGLDWRRSPRAQERQDPRNLAPVALYFSPDAGTAQEMELGPDYDLYEVDLSGVSTRPDPYQPDAAFYTLDAISPGKVRRITAAKTADMAHRPADDGPPASNLLASSGEWTAPPDIYEHPERYTGHHELLPQTMQALRVAHGDPSTPVTLYRAQPTGAGLRTGDWVSLSRSYAEIDLRTEPQGRSVEAYTVPAATVRWAGDDLMEWGYWGPSIPGRKVASVPGVVMFRDGGPGALPEQWPYCCPPGEHEVRAEVDGQVVGQIRWLTSVNPNANVTVGYVTFAGVRPEYHRLGIATEMLSRAREIDPRVHHSNHLTDDGAAWSKAVGSRNANGVSARASSDDDAISYLVRVEFGRRRPDAVTPVDGPVTPAHLDIHAGERYVWVHANDDTEARLVACEMVAAGSDDAGNPIGRTGDMPTKAEVIHAVASVPCLEA